MIVQKKAEKNKEKSSSSTMMVGEEGQGAEEELYNLMRGHTTLMVTEDQEPEESDDSEDGSVQENKEEENKGQSSSVVPDARSLYDLVTGRDPGRSDGEESSSVEQEWGQANDPLLSNPNFAPTPWRRFEWGNETEAQGPEPEPISWGRGRPRRSSSPSDSSSSSRSHSPDQHESLSSPFKQKSTQINDEDDSESEEIDEEESTSERENEGVPPKEKDDSDDSDSDEGTIGQIFKEIRNGIFNPNKRRKRFEGQRRNERVVTTSSPYLEEDRDVATRGDCVMNTTEALHRLTRDGRYNWDKEDEWIIIKVPKKANGKIFYVDYCDGDSEDEFHWLEGPYRQQLTTVEDLVNIRREQPRKARRRRGLTEFRDDWEEDCKNPHGIELMSPNLNKDLERMKPEAALTKILKEKFHTPH